MTDVGYLLALGLACAFGVGSAWTAVKNRHAAGARPLLGVALASIVWAASTIGLVVTDAPAAKLRWLQVAYLGMVAAPITFVWFALEYTSGGPQAGRWTLGGLWLGGGLVLLLVWTNPIHHLYWADLAYGADVPAGLRTVPAAGFWGFVAFTYALLIFGSVLLVRYALTAPGLYRTQSAALLAAVVVPWAANVPHALQWMRADYTPVALAATTGLLCVAMHRYRLTDLSPIALRTVFESIAAGVVIVDREGRVVDANAAAHDMLGLSDDEIGASFDDLVAADDLLGRLCDADPDQSRLLRGAELTPEREPSSSERRYVEARVTPIRPARGQPGGRLVVLTDITERERQRRRLERKNQQLEKFASVVSHDLRSPLNVALGNLSIAWEALPSSAPASEENGQDAAPTTPDRSASPDEADAPVHPPLRRAHRALGRMETLIDDLLTLAAGGTEITDAEPVALAAVATDAWDTVDTKDATLTLRTEAPLQADRSRLHQLLENLLYNAIVHGGPEVTVTIGDRPDGFYVADDGPGFPNEPPETLLGAGYTTHEDGTGFGLGIVHEIAKAHGWTLRLGTSAADGARIDVTGIDRPDASPADSPPHTETSSPSRA